MRLQVSLILLLGASASTVTVAEVPFNGKKGQALLSAVAETARPQAVIDKTKLNFTFRDEFTGMEIAVSAGRLPGGYSWGCMVPSEWWSNSPDVYGSRVSDDLYNLLPVTEETARHRKDLTPGYVTVATFANGLWSAGQGVIYGVETDLYSPPVALRGELARAFFYMSAVYHVNLWTPRGYMMMTTKAYPGLTEYAVPLLLGWHRDYPPTAQEVAKNEFGEREQGNRNPFVDYPDLVEYIWGSKKDDSFIIEGEPRPLRSAYSLAAGDMVDLYSPEVPADAAWSIDDMPVSSTSVAASELGLGEHRLGYTSAQTGERGMLLIKIVE